MPAAIAVMPNGQRALDASRLDWAFGVYAVQPTIPGALVPHTLRRVGADPATASSIFLTTATDVASMGMVLGLATLLL